MASLTKAISKEFFDSVLPTFGNHRKAMPVWDNGQRMFIVNEYESEKGNRYYMGLRFSENIVFVEHVGMFHTWTYIDAIDMYAFNGMRLELVQRREYEEKKFHNEEFIRQESEQMLCDYLEGCLKMQQINLPREEVVTKAKAIVEGCYKSFLDSDYNTRLTQILPQIERQ